MIPIVRGSRCTWFPLVWRVCTINTKGKAATPPCIIENQFIILGRHATEEEEEEEEEEGGGRRKGMVSGIVVVVEIVVIVVVVI